MFIEQHGGVKPHPIHFRGRCVIGMIEKEAVIIVE